MAPPRTEPDSCRHKAKRGTLSRFKFCPPCWEQDYYSASFFSNRKLTTIGTCHLLHPSNAQGWKAIKPNDRLWDDPQWEGYTQSSDDTDEEDDKENCPPIKRPRKSVTLFQAHPSQGSQMNSEKCIIANKKLLRVRRASPKKDTEIQALRTQIRKIGRKVATTVLLDEILTFGAETQQGRTNIAKEIANGFGEKKAISLPSGGVSRAAINKARRSVEKISSGLSKILDPCDPERFLSMVQCHPTNNNETTPQSSTLTGALLCQPDPSTLAPAENSSNTPDLTERLHTLPPQTPCQQQRNSQTPRSILRMPSAFPKTPPDTLKRVRLEYDAVPLPRVTAASLAAIMPSDIDSDFNSGSENEEFDSESDSSCDDGDNSLSVSEKEIQRTAHLKRQQERRQKFYRKSMTYKTKEQRDKEVKEVRNYFGQVWVDHVKSLKTPRERRPYLAQIVLKFSRKAINHALGRVHIDKMEYRQIKIHAKWPGPGEPVQKQTIRRLRVDHKLLRRLLTFLNGSGNLQRTAFGQQLEELIDGELVEMDNVARNKKLEKLVYDFLCSILSELALIAAGETINNLERCCKLHQTLPFFRCLQPKDHVGKCAFTPENSISAGTVRNLIQSLTVGDIKTLSGLDDVKVLKGRDNFKALRGMVKVLLVDKPDKLAAFLKRIDDCELYHKTDFVLHLLQTGTHRCNCITCGFHDKDSLQDIVCPKKDEHQLCCTRCTDAFSIIRELKAIISSKLNKLQQSYALNHEDSIATSNPPSDSDDFCLEATTKRYTPMTCRELKALLKENGLAVCGRKQELVERLVDYKKVQAEVARSIIPMRELSTEEVLALQELEEMAYDISCRKEDLLEYRSHMARHLSEDLYAKEQANQLDDDTAIITSDYKMKILSCFFRENQKKWFGKRGTSLIGFMLMVNSEDETARDKGIKDVTFVMMVTDDCLQDDWAVACSKSIIYSKYLPKRIKKVHFVCDGAGCFRSSLQRAFQPFWKIWAGVDEISYRITPAGDGKSALDGMFGRLNTVLHSAADQGASYYDSTTIAEAIEETNGLASTQFARFAPTRSKQIDVTTAGGLSLESVLLTTLDPDRAETDNRTHAFKHSGFGEGSVIDPTRHFTFYKRNMTGRRKKKNDLLRIDGIYNADGTVNSTIVQEISPEYDLFVKTKNMKEFTTTKLAKAGEGAGLAKVRGQKRRNRIATKAEKKRGIIRDERKQMKKAGLYLCDCRCERTKRYCRAVYLTRKGLCDHERQATHDFPKGENARDFLLIEASKPGGLVESGSRPDRQNSVLFESVVAVAKVCGGEEDAHCFGRFNRKEATIAYRKPAKLVAVLKDLFDIEPKLRAGEMRARMRVMRDTDGSRLFCWVKRKTTGMLLSEDQIQGWITTQTQNKKKNGLDAETDEVAAEQHRLISEIEATDK